MRKFFQVLLRLAFSAFLAFVLLEAGLAWLCASGRLKIQRPSYCLSNVWSRFWTDSNPHFGVWHDPHSVYKHVTRDFRLTYKANTFGIAITSFMCPVEFIKYERKMLDLDADALIVHFDCDPLSLPARSHQYSRARCVFDRV